MNKVTRYLRGWLSPKWISIKAYDASWEYNDGSISKVMYEIQYSLNRQCYRLKSWGDKPKLHKMYPVVVDIYYRCVYNHMETTVGFEVVKDILK